ncbi:uncharacterized protein BKA55DRAFT_541563 [Fusarium redolens]|uniref:Uncharacterized protein n=1 Tax=Fusarium redolens TaxID=48865 RepID=A0A9P9GPE8_FUSRE|nr:uncharacterized protein BKA55DRAFT_541563 [Fusarium redolens]KAH7243303.1 hypothetical protein BKA55DRAFT_541563 [Fusarium redolens]
MAETSVDEAEKCSLKRRKKNDTASAKEQSMKASDKETKVGVDERTAQMWREEGVKGGRGMNFDVVQVDLQKIRDQETQGAVDCSTMLRLLEEEVDGKGRIDNKKLKKEWMKLGYENGKNDQRSVQSSHEVVNSRSWKGKKRRDTRSQSLSGSYWTKTETGLEATDDGQRRASQELKGEDWCIFSGGAEGQVSWFRETDNALPLLGCGEGEALGPGGTLDKGTIA